MPKYCALNKDFFKTWSADMAYVLGYISADGNISIGKRGNCYLALEGIDKELIEDIRKSLGSGHKITKRNRASTVSYRLQIGSKEMVNDLICLGVTPKKSKRIKFPLIENQYIGDFVRGYFDGDGNVYLMNFKRVDRKTGWCNYARIMFVSSSSPMLEGLKTVMEERFGILGGQLKHRENYYRLYYHRKSDVVRIFSLFYAHKPTLYLKRKLVYFIEALRKSKMGA